MKVSELFEGKDENIARLRKDYKNAMAWVNAPKSEVPDHERSKWEQQARKMREHAKKQYHIDLNEAGRVFRSGVDVTGEKPKAAEPVGDPKQFRKGQKVKVRKTGKEVEVLGFTKDGLVQTASTNPGDLAIKGWADFSHKELGGNLFNARGHQTYLPRELE